METSQSIASISKALVDFHKAVGKIEKDETNPFFKKAYCTLPNIIQAIQPHLNSSGLAVIQFPEGESELTTRLIHESGEWMQASYKMPVAKQNDPQALGSAISYQRRYSIMAVLCLTIVDEDDDANEVSGKNAKEGAQQAQGEQELPWLNENTKEFTGALKKLAEGTTTVAKIQAVFRINKTILAKLKAAEKKD